MSAPHDTSRERRRSHGRSAPKIWIGVLGALLLTTLAVWLLWGFRWPPTLSAMF